MTATPWKCTTCGRVRQAGDGSPLRETLTSKYRVGKCRKCRADRFFIPAGEHARDLPAGEAAKAAGMERTSVTATLEGWAQKFDATVHALALQRVDFTSEDVTARVGMPASASRSAVGARMNAAAQRGLILWTGRMAKAQRPNQHAALLKVWRGA